MIIGANKIIPICNNIDILKEEDILGYFKFVWFYSGKLSFWLL